MGALWREKEIAAAPSQGFSNPTSSQALTHPGSPPTHSLQQISASQTLKHRPGFSLTKQLAGAVEAALPLSPVPNWTSYLCGQPGQEVPQHPKASMSTTVHNQTSGSSRDSLRVQRRGRGAVLDSAARIPLLQRFSKRAYKDPGAPPPLPESSPSGRG
jgi:hypothetical protein